jgi:ADP-ribosylglycohydrolase
MAEASQTHLHPESIDAAVATVVLCRFLILGTEWEEALGRASEGRGEAVQNALKAHPGGPVRKGGYAPDVLAAAVYFLERAENFADALERSLRFAGPANYCPVLVGALGGARWGRPSIPYKWDADVMIHARVESAARRLSDRWPKG